MESSASQPFVSVVIPTYNCGDFLPEALRSVQEQTYRGFEVIVVDDGSTDHTRELMSRLESTIRCVHQENSGGPSKPRNVGVELARGEWIAFFDADDLMRPNKLESQVRVISQEPNADLVFTDFEVIDVDGATIRPSFLERFRAFRLALREQPEGEHSLISGGELFHALLRSNFVGTSSAVVRKRVLTSIGGFDETLRGTEDYDLWLRLAIGGATFAFLDRVEHAYRRRPGSLVSQERVRLPQMLSIYERQRPHVESAEAVTLLDEKIRETSRDYAWALRKANRNREALEYYWRARSGRGDLASVPGLVLSALKACRDYVMGRRDA